MSFDLVCLQKACLLHSDFQSSHADGDKRSDPPEWLSGSLQNVCTLSAAGRISLCFDGPLRPRNEPTFDQGGLRAGHRSLE